MGLSGPVVAPATGEVVVPAHTTIDERDVEKIETAVEASFQEHFVAAMGLPHTVDAFPELANHVSLPKRTRRKKRAR